MVFALGVSEKEEASPGWANRTGQTTGKAYRCRLLGWEAMGCRSKKSDEMALEKQIKGTLDRFVYSAVCRQPPQAV